MPLPGGTTFRDISNPADPTRLRRNSLPLAGIGTSGGSRRNSAHPSFGPAWKQVKLPPRTVLSFSIVRLLSGPELVVNDRRYDGKHLPKATSSLGDPLMRMRLRSSAHSRLRSFARKPSHVSLSANTRRPAPPWGPSC